MNCYKLSEHFGTTHKEMVLILHECVTHNGNCQKKEHETTFIANISQSCGFSTK